MKLQIAPPSPVRVSYDEAMLYCFCLDYNGYKDWRLPTQDEYNSNSRLSGSWSWTADDHDSTNKAKWLATPVRDVVSD